MGNGLNELKIGGDFLNFKVVSKSSLCVEKNIVYLIEDNWDDWFTYSTLYIMHYIDEKGIKHRIGGVKIGQRGQSVRRPLLPVLFTELDNNFFSLGSSEDYYERLNKLNESVDLREIILTSLNDIARNLDLLDEVRAYDVTQTSLLRDKTISTVKGQYNRMAGGGARLTDYEFSYFPANYCDDKEDVKIKLDFNVVPEEIPPTNIHVLIGKNGVGKTTILKNMLRSLESHEDDTMYGKVDMGWSNNFANIVFVSFSAFDEYMKIEQEIIPYLHIGLSKEDGIKKYDELYKEFAESLYMITKGDKKKLWFEAISILESDNTFIELSVKEWSMVNYREKEINLLMKEYPLKENEKLREYKERIEKIIFANEVTPKFKELSSGHKVILLTVAKLVETVEEQTLVLLDEPEEHLHPPLVSAFIRALSNLLIYRNGVGIISTHSPVIVQEVPKKCVWILRRSGNELIADRPQIETFGENLGILTSEIFGFEVTNSGFHKMLINTVSKKSNYKSALRVLKGELGEEGKTMLRSLMYEKEQTEGDLDD
jgi:ABC-type multidrug transport system ATPase subunit